MSNKVQKNNIENKDLTEDVKPPTLPKKSKGLLAVSSGTPMPKVKPAASDVESTEKFSVNHMMKLRARGFKE